MIVIDFILRNQIMIGMLCPLFLFVPWRRRRKFFSLRLIFSAAAALCLAGFVPIPAPFVFLTHFVATNLLVWICFDCHWKYILFSATCAYCVQHMTSKLTYMLIVFLLRFNYAYIKYNGVLINFLTLLAVNAVVCITIYFIWTRRTVGNRELKFGNFKILVYMTGFIVSAVFFSYYTERALVASSPNFAAGYICLNGLCALIALIVLLLNFTNCRGELLVEEKRTLEQLLKKDKMRYELAKQNMERINIQYHDIKKCRATAMSVEESKKFSDELKKFTKLYYTGNEVVDVTLSEKASLCAEKGIQFICIVDGNRLNMIKPYQIYSLLGNAIDNAIEALYSVTDEDKKVIRLDIFGRGNMSVVRIVNYVANEPKMENGIPVTTKRDKDNHGFGIKSIKNISEEYGGITFISTRNHEFTLVVAIPCE